MARRGIQKGLVPENDVLGDRERRHQHEMLVHHSDAVGDGIVRTVDANRLAVDPNLALVRLVQAVDDVHQRRLARAVLAQQAWISPFSRTKSTWSLARTPGNRLVIPETCRTGAMVPLAPLKG